MPLIVTSEKWIIFIVDNIVKLPSWHNKTDKQTISVKDIQRKGDPLCEWHELGRNIIPVLTTVVIVYKTISRPSKETKLPSLRFSFERSATYVKTMIDDGNNFVDFYR